MVITGFGSRLLIRKTLFFYDIAAIYELPVKRCFGYLRFFDQFRYSIIIKFQLLYICGGTMLQLKNIKKKYNTGGYEQIALDDVSLHRRTGPL